MNYNSVSVTTFSEIQLSDQVIILAAISTATRPIRPPLTPPTGLIKATVKPPSPSSRQIPRTIPNPTHYELYESEPISRMATLKPNEERLIHSVSLFNTSALQPQNSTEIETWAKNLQPPKIKSLKFLKLLGSVDFCITLAVSIILPVCHNHMLRGECRIADLLNVSLQHNQDKLCADTVFFLRRSQEPKRSLKIVLQSLKICFYNCVNKAKCALEQ